MGKGWAGGREGRGGGGRELERGEGRGGGEARSPEVKQRLTESSGQCTVYTKYIYISTGSRGESNRPTAQLSRNSDLFSLRTPVQSFKNIKTLFRTADTMTQ